ncbi:unnamed protein product, partial [Amoebophrya sp. A120]
FPLHHDQHFRSRKLGKNTKHWNNKTKTPPARQQDLDNFLLADYNNSRSKLRVSV